MGTEKVFISEDDQYYFGEGTHYEIYKKLGAHESVENGEKGFYFAVWAPHARSVSVVGEFNDWNPDAHTMERLEPLGIWQKFVPGVKSEQLYKFYIVKSNGEIVYRQTPLQSMRRSVPEPRQRPLFPERKVSLISGAIPSGSGNALKRT